MATSYDDIVVKLKRFIRKFYTNELLRGGILFIFFGLLYFLLITGLEYFFWFGKGVRKLLFWLFLTLEAGLFIRFVLWPVFKLIKLAKGIDYDAAAVIIGNHFPEVSDQLTNILQLKKMGSSANSDLLAAGIDQKAKELQPVPFERAIHFSTSFKYLKFLVIPVLFIGILWGIGKTDWYNQGYERLAHYNQAYEPPAPFSFAILNENLSVEEGNSLILKVETIGEVAPDAVQMVSDQGTFLLQADEHHIFTYHLENLKESFSFVLEGNNVRSSTYIVDVVKTPKIEKLKMKIDFPAYLRRDSKSFNGLQNIRIPEGSTVQWEIVGKQIDQIQIHLEEDSLYTFKEAQDHFHWSSSFVKPTRYEITSSNKALRDYERLHSRIDIIKDEFPELHLRQKMDSSQGIHLFFKGQAMDDYGITGLYLRYYPTGNKGAIKSIRIPFSASNFTEFYAAFPDTIQLIKGKSYELYFEVFDNDGVHGSKATRSKLFSSYQKTDREKEQERLENSSGNIAEFSKSVENFKKNDHTIKKFREESMEKGKLDFKLKNSLKDVLDREKDGMKSAMELVRELEKNLKEADNKTEESENLRKRLGKSRDNLSKNEELLKELEKYSKELSNDNLNEKLEQYNHQRKNQFRSLESLLELTKRLYVKQKNKKLVEDLKELQEDQERLGTTDDDKSEDQKKITKEFDHWKNSFDQLEKENEKLRNPRDLSRDEKMEENVNRELEKAFENLKNAENEEQNQNQEKADDFRKEGNKSQRKGSEFMKKMLENMEADLEEMDLDQLQEDVGTLRRILANLLSFSFDQEDLMEVLQGVTKDHPRLGQYVQHQQYLKENFKHVDDSLYALALRNPVIGEAIFEEISKVDYNMDAGLANLAKSRIYNGVSNQRFIITSANELANLLDDALQNMEMQMESMGRGQGALPQSQPNGESEFQLDDIIKSQEELLKELQGDSNGESQESGEDEDSYGENGKDKEGNLGTEGEDNFEETFEIYKKQAELREKLNALLDRLEDGEREYKPLRKDMEKMEEDILNGSRDAQTQQRMQTVIERMLRLKEALYDKEKDSQREAETNTQNYERNTLHYEEEIKKKFGSEEILNRQALPLQNLYKRLIKDYFQDHD